jgi:hypothetical protein
MTVSEPCLALAPALGLIADCVAHVGCCWLLKGQRRLLGFTIALAAGLVVTATLSTAVLSSMNLDKDNILVQSLFNCASYLALAYGYYSFVGLNFSSLRIRLLQEVLLAEDGLPLCEVQRRYDTEEVVGRRLDRLRSSGHLIERGGRFYLGKRTLLVVARLNDIVRFLVLGTTMAPSQGRTDDDRERSIDCEPLPCVVDNDSTLLARK